jgi:hypothetical protein
MVAIPCAFVPVPITFSVLVASIFFLGAYQSIPVFVAIFTAYTIMCGSGLMKKMADERKLREMKMKSERGNNDITDGNNGSSGKDNNQQGNAAENMP